jgi:hypothetical protein
MFALTDEQSAKDSGVERGTGSSEKEALEQDGTV